MKKLVSPLIVILSLTMFSCEKAATKSTVEQSDQNKVVENTDRDTEDQGLETEKITLAKSLQGKWKEVEYPFRTVEFQNSTVKFVEEGTANDPKFEKYELGTQCPYENTNIKAGNEKMLLILPEKRVCEQIDLSNDTLTLSGYSTNTNSDYKILYVRAK
ncbi:hypothetical protein [Kaistella palustris]|uniref:hypothetical protein n=1 Tax=Kaistella palustris TaxID=493376 RepID=UPI00041EF964|nr:hypothetical protein [Kaistella palustris]